jgi:hypothetical protein
VTPAVVLQLGPPLEPDAFVRAAERLLGTRACLKGSRELLGKVIVLWVLLEDAGLVPIYRDGQLDV